MNTTAVMVLKSHLPDVLNGISSRMVARIRIIRPSTSTTSCITARSGAFSARNARHRPMPAAPTAITLERRSFISTAMMAAAIMNIRMRCISVIAILL